MSVRVKFVIVGVLLAIALCATAVAAGKTIQAVQGFQQTQSLVRAKDTRTVRSWMTIPYIARTYDVPESYLYHWLNLSDLLSAEHVTLRMIAVRMHRTVAEVVQSVQQAILAYRGQPPPERKTPTPGGAGLLQNRRAWQPQGNCHYNDTTAGRAGVLWRVIVVAIPLWLPGDFATARPGGGTGARRMVEMRRMML